MLTSALTIFTVIANMLLASLPAAMPGRMSGIGQAIGDPAYEGASRSITNWKSEATGWLNPKSAIVLAVLFGMERPVVTRCVKLNNYWCIKSARWEGEIGNDADGHVGFASADKGADAAALLLRRYYLDYGRKSAIDIVRRWAPAECDAVTGLGGLILAVKGIGGTVRAKYLAAHRVKLTAGPAKGKGVSSGRVSVVIQRAFPVFRVPDIAVGMGEKPHPASVVAQKVASKPASPSTASTSNGSGSSDCAPDETRLQNYATRMVDGLGISSHDDLKLFTPDGNPLPNLVPVMLSMADFELGLLRPDRDLIEGAVRRAAMRAAERTP